MFSGKLQIRHIKDKEIRLEHQGRLDRSFANDFNSLFHSLVPFTFKAILQMWIDLQTHTMGFTATMIIWSFLRRMLLWRLIFSMDVDPNWDVGGNGAPGGSPHGYWENVQTKQMQHLRWGSNPDLWHCKAPPAALLRHPTFDVTLFKSWRH